MKDDSTPRILVGVDGSGSSIVALQGATKIASAMNAHIRAVIAWEYPAMFYPVSDWSPEDDAKSALDAVLRQVFGTQSPTNVDAEVRRGHASKVLIDESKNADLLVVGSRGHGGFAGLLLGSVSAACAQHSHCPVLITHRDDASSITSEPSAMQRTD